MRTFGIVFALLPLAWAQQRAECLCGLFASTGTAEYEVHRLPSIDVNNCQDEQHCRTRCIDEFEAIFNNGGLDFVMPTSGLTMGQESCQFLQREHGITDFGPHELYGYYNLCNGPWIFDGEESGRERLCCQHGRYPGRC